MLIGEFADWKRLGLSSLAALVVPMAAAPLKASELPAGPEPIELAVLKNDAPAPSLVESDTLRVVTLNLAHGRGQALNQLLVRSKRFEHNLDAIAAYLKDTAADVVALQEADGPSFWSGGFDHVIYLAEKAGYPFTVHHDHTRSPLARYGVALLSRWPIERALGFTFPPSPPTNDKGFVIAQIRVGGGELVDLVSVHLDFSRQSVRQTQIAGLRSILDARTHPAIVMGDFNSDWFADEATVRQMVEHSDFHAWKPEATDLPTYKNRRLDWILVSRELAFSDVRVGGEGLSDHRAVIADVVFPPGSVPEAADRLR